MVNPNAGYDKGYRINKARIYAVEEGAAHLCFLCAQRVEGTWRMVGFDEFGELWICQHCWDLTPDVDKNDFNSDKTPT